MISCVSKVMERMVAARLYYSAETRGILNNQQAGFRKGRGCEDQITKVIQAIQDGFNNKVMERSVLVLLDFSKAYVTVWREKLIIALLEQGVPSGIERWLRGFLDNRQARVRFKGELSRSRAIRQGLPQGSVPSYCFFST